MKKIFVFLAVGIVLLLSAGVFAFSGDLSGGNKNSGGLEKDVENFVKNVVEKKSLSENEVESVKQVSFTELPKNIDLKNIDDTNLALYEINMDGEKPVFVITVSEETFKKTLSSEDYKRSFLNFGTKETVNGSGFLETATGVKTSFEKGYVMTRSGSITAMSTNLEIADEGNSEKIEIVIYKNGEPIGFGNSMVADSRGVVKDYDVLSYGTVGFEQGDVISVYVKSDGNILWKDVITMVEITTSD